MTADDREHVLARLRLDEGFRAHPYLDTVGALTIGFGRNISDRGIRRIEAEFMLRNDVDDAETELREAFWWYARLDPARQGVLINMAVNMGLPRLRTFKRALAAIEASDWNLARAELLDSKWSRQVGARADRLARQMRTGSWA